MKKTLSTLLALSLFGLALDAGTTHAKPMVIADDKPSAAGPKIQIAILLDTSSSMDGLINQARTRLWSIVNALAAGKRAGQRPIIEIALYEYGKSTLEASDGYIRRILPFSRDLDALAEKLFSLTTNGGDEYAGWVIQRATKELEWSAKSSDVKLLFIAGNEGFDQGSVNFAAAIESARARGVTVNTVYCGGEADHDARLWQRGASQGKGSFAMLDHNQSAVVAASPYDDELNRLSSQMNATYVYYGKGGAKKAERQVAQDKAAEQAGAAPTRASAKASVAYNNAGWDLVDADASVDVKKLSKEDLPPEMQGMSASDRVAHVAKMKTQRQQLKNKIAALSAKRDAFIAKERQRQAAPAALDDQMVRASKAAAQKSGFTF